MSTGKLHQHSQTGIVEMDQENPLELQIVRSIQTAVVEYLKLQGHKA